MVDGHHQMVLLFFNISLIIITQDSHHQHRHLQNHHRHIAESFSRSSSCMIVNGGLQVSAKLCHSNTPVGQVSLNGIIIICSSFDCIIIIIATTIVINILIMVLLVISRHQMAKFSPSTINGIIIPVNIVIMIDDHHLHNQHD